MVAFISYSHVDRQLALRVSRTLRRFGLEHWWDDRIELSKVWNDEIDANLTAASAVLVLWTHASARSEWVIREATFAQAHEKLVQLRIQGALLPVDFSALQAAEVPVWEENTLPRGIRSALNKIAMFMGKPEVVDEHARALGLRISFEKVDAFVFTKKHHEGYFPKLDGPLYKDIWEMGMTGTIKLYDELGPGSRSSVNDERYYELIEYLADEDGTLVKR